MRARTQNAIAAVGIGAIAGMRSLSAPALARHALARDGVRASGPAARALSRPALARALDALAVGEAVADKMPWVPDRVEPVPLAGRAISGALAAAAIGADRRPGRTTLAAIGAGVAVGSALLGFRLRRRASRAGVANVVAGLAEDALVAALGAGVLAWRRRR